MFIIKIRSGFNQLYLVTAQVIIFNPRELISNKAFEKLKNEAEAKAAKQASDLNEMKAKLNEKGLFENNLAKQRTSVNLIDL